MTIQSLQRRCSRNGDREQLADRIARRRYNKYWRAPGKVRGWHDLPLLRGVAAFGIDRPSTSFAARHVQRLCRLPEHRARLIAELAGFKMEDET